MFVLFVIKKIYLYYKKVCVSNFSLITLRVNVRSLCWPKKTTQYYFLIDAQEHSQISSR
jgi:hypothetical protein